MRKPKRKPAATRPARTPIPDARKRLISLRCSPSEYELIAESANEAGLAVGGYLRSLALGSAGPRAVRRPFVDRVALARLLGELGKIGSNLNQLARYANTTRRMPPDAPLPALQADLGAMRDALMLALYREG